MRDIHEDLIIICQHFGTTPSEGAGYYLARGREIPDSLLPGRALRRLAERNRESYDRLISTDWRNVAPWWIKAMCS